MLQNLFAKQSINVFLRPSIYFPSAKSQDAPTMQANKAQASYLYNRGNKEFHFSMLTY